MPLKKQLRNELSTDDKTTQILLFLAQGFEDLEAVSILDVFGWTQYHKNIKKASVTTTGFHPVVKGRFGLKIEPDVLAAEVNPDDYQALVLPGGFYSYGFDEAFDTTIYALARKIHQNGGYVATMCVGILPVAEAGLLKGKSATTYPHSRNHDNMDRLKKSGARPGSGAVVIDDRIISCSGPGSALEVAFLLMECLLGTETTRKVKRYMIYR
jgi:4-methyl-5(b-hydroxyethyl)-thiazole monophosphate biosynthesis